MSRKKRAVTRPSAAVLVALVAVLAWSGVAEAGNVYRIKTAPSPSNGEPILGGGSWIVNKPSGYYLGRAMPGTEFNVVDTTPKNWHFGRALDPAVNMCGWVQPGSMGTRVGSAADSCSQATREYLRHRRNFGRDFNAGSHKMGTGSPVTSRSCSFFYNYFHGTNFRDGANGGHWANKAPGMLTAGTGKRNDDKADVLYRFTTLDRKAVVVRDPKLGWGFVAASCVDRPGRTFNDND